MYLWVHEWVLCIYVGVTGVKVLNRSCDDAAHLSSVLCVFFVGVGVWVHVCCVGNMFWCLAVFCCCCGCWWDFCVSVVTAFCDFLRITFLRFLLTAVCVCLVAGVSAVLVCAVHELNMCHLLSLPFSLIGFWWHWWIPLHAGLVNEITFHGCWRFYLI